MSSADEALSRFVHGQLRSLIANEHYPCVGARSAIKTGRSTFRLYGEMATRETTRALACDLLTFIAEHPASDPGLVTFLSSFTGPHPRDEAHFERVLWQQLATLSDVDPSPWDPSVSPDVTDPHYAFSFGGRAFFVAALNPAASRYARRFAWPTIAWNAHGQFDRLRKKGKYERFRDVIRERDRALQGTINPAVSDFGERSEAEQYSGRPRPASRKEDT